MTRVLVVDDEIDTLNLLRTILEISGYQAVTTLNSTDAITLAEIEHPDLVLLDIMMPQLDGFTLCKMMRLHPATMRLPIVFVTAYSALDLEDRRLEAGADMVLPKPVGMDTLIETVERAKMIRGLPTAAHVPVTASSAVSATPRPVFTAPIPTPATPAPVVAPAPTPKAAPATTPAPASVSPAAPVPAAIPPALPVANPPPVPASKPAVVPAAAPPPTPVSLPPVPGPGASPATPSPVVMPPSAPDDDISITIGPESH
ncbi:MAG TPA: response regulator [Aggregatilineales bacterium]|nr:response regulator [Aggregatilineales bacterium]